MIFHGSLIPLQHHFLPKDFGFSKALKTLDLVQKHLNNRYHNTPFTEDDHAALIKIILRTPGNQQLSREEAGGFGTHLQNYIQNQISMTTGERALKYIQRYTDVMQRKHPFFSRGCYWCLVYLYEYFVVGCKGFEHFERYIFSSLGPSQQTLEPEAFLGAVQAVEYVMTTPKATLKRT